MRFIHIDLNWLKKKKKKSKLQSVTYSKLPLVKNILTQLHIFCMNGYMAIEL